MRRTVFLVAALAGCLSVQPFAWAEKRRGYYQPRPVSSSPWEKKQDWTTQTEDKLAYGLKNTLLGWTELFTEPYEAWKHGENLGAGVGEGVWNAVGKTVGGAVDVVTFPIPQISVPLPEGGR